MLQSERRHDPYPFTWEIPVGALTAAIVTAALGVHLGRAIANWTAGAGWGWPTGRGLFSSLPAVLEGNAAAGLATPLTTPAPSAAVTGWIIATETVLLVGLGIAGVIAMRRWGPGRMRGMATAAQAEAILGLSRLRRVRSIIRPDLHPPEHHRGTTESSHSSPITRRRRVGPSGDAQATASRPGLSDQAPRNGHP